MRRPHSDVVAGRVTTADAAYTQVLIVDTKQIRSLKSPVSLPVHQYLGWDNI